MECYTIYCTDPQGTEISSSFVHIVLQCCYAPIKALPHLPSCGQTKGRMKGYDENFGPGCGSLGGII